MKAVDFGLRPDMCMPHEHSLGLAFGLEQLDQFGRVVEGGLGGRVQMMVDEDQGWNVGSSIQGIGQPLALRLAKLAPGDVGLVQRVEQDQSKVVMLNHSDPTIESPIFLTW